MLLYPSEISVIVPFWRGHEFFWNLGVKSVGINSQVKLNKYGESLRRIGVRLTGISVDDMTRAERQIADILVEAGIMEEKDDSYVTVKDPKKAVYNKRG